MATVKSVERQIQRLEGLAVRFLHPDGHDVRGDRSNMPGYDYKRKAPNSFRVSQWIERRFRPKYPGFGVEVLKADGSKAHGNTRLGTVRGTFL
jgi:hypothetical protein